jgi:phage-related protein
VARRTVDDVRTSQGGRPVREFLDGLPTVARAKVYAAIEMLAAEGNRLRMPRSRSLGKGLQELRVDQPQGPFRIIYCFQPDRRALLLHAFVKRTEQTPQRDLELASERRPKEGDRKK